MIREIEIENFRSIRKDKITLEPLTVLIGANGSGKSNLVKAFEFISEIPRVGIQLAVSHQGGRDGMVPKEVPKRDISKSQVSFRYRACLPPPEDTINYPNSVDVIHEFEMSFKRGNQIRINKEKLSFQNVLYVGNWLGDIYKGGGDRDIIVTDYKSETLFYMEQENGRLKFDFSPPPTQSNIDGYLYWLGLEFLVGQVKSHEQLKVFLNKFRHDRGDASSRSGGLLLSRMRKSFVDPDFRSVLDFAPQSQIFIASIKSIRRYDFLLNELRREQSPSDSPVLSKVGENLPAALRSLQSDKIAYGRLKNSVETIAPHIMNLRSSTLRTGNEFVEFFESKNGRGVESWESSDGSLRALAILVALESARRGDTIIIEEPEQNLHPWAVRALIDHMREVVEMKSIQLILTTHSEHVLDQVDANEVRVVTRNPKDGTKFKHIEDIVSKNKVEKGEIGRLWVKGILGGIPTGGL